MKIHPDNIHTGVVTRVISAKRQNVNPTFNFLKLGVFLIENRVPLLIFSGILLLILRSACESCTITKLWSENQILSPTY